jgi:hypothetical protein
MNETNVFNPGFWKDSSHDQAYFVVSFAIFVAAVIYYLFTRR